LYSVLKEVWSVWNRCLVLGSEMKIDGWTEIVS